MKTWKTAMWVLIAAFVGIVGYYGYSFFDFANDSHEESRFAQFDKPNGNIGKDTPDTVQYTPPKWEGTQRVNILLLGGDSRGLKKNEVPRSDTIMVASIDPVTKKAHLFSILRDTYVKIPEHGSERINTAIVLGGPKLAMQTVSDLLGLEIQYYVYTDFEGFIKLVDEIGGIEIDVEKNMNYTSRADGPEYDIHLKKGLQHMDGKTALGYVRFRHDALSDYSRTERQRKFMTALAQKLQSTTSLVRLPRILNAIDPYIETNLSVTEMLKLAALGFEAKAQQVQGVQIPPSDLLREVTRRGASVLEADSEDLREYVKDVLAKTPEPPAGANAAAEADRQMQALE
ncbi:LCP family protein [Paenibacillus thermotolerans]|uniref:LCP family protein n=1 Tax=Paenibacillus thermotolerans TaxID=3027807 RepID=UPI002367B5DA|nr:MULTISPECIES: LCP family protein [unclassified Paenibacillus]